MALTGNTSGDIQGASGWTTMAGTLVHPATTRTWFDILRADSHKFSNLRIADAQVSSSSRS